MEDTLTLEELNLLHDARLKAEHRSNKFQAALQGVDIDEEADADFERIQMRAQAELAGMSEDEFVFDMIGIEFEPDDD